MNSEYFADGIEEELHGACDYAKKGIEIKAMKPEWSAELAEMAEQELGHAENLYKMFEEYMEVQKKAYDGKLPGYMEKNWNRAAECYDKHFHKTQELLNILK